MGFWIQDFMVRSWISNEIWEGKSENERSLSANKDPFEDDGESSEGKKGMVLIRDYRRRGEQTLPQIHTKSWWGSGAGQVYADYLNFSFEQFVYFYIGVPRELKTIFCCPPSLLLCSLARTYSLSRSDAHNESLICVRVRASALFSWSWSDDPSCQAIQKLRNPGRHWRKMEWNCLGGGWSGQNQCAFAHGSRAHQYHLARWTSSCWNVEPPPGPSPSCCQFLNLIPRFLNWITGQNLRSGIRNDMWMIIKAGLNLKRDCPFDER